MATVNVSRIAAALNLSEQRVQQLVKEGMPREARGQYDPMKCMLFYIRYLQSAIERKTIPTLEGDDAGEREARVRLLSAHANLREMELAKERSQLVSTADANKSVADLERVTRAHVMAIPARTAPALVAETSRVMIQARIEKSCKQALSELARYGRDKFSASQRRSI